MSVNAVHPLLFSTDTYEVLYGYLARHWVQKALGVPVNYTAGSQVVSNAFQGTGDMSRGGFLEAIGYLLESGVKVALMYGDRDYACNWQGGERVSVAINYSSSEQFAKAGYTPILLDQHTISGQVRQYGNFSFSRVYQAGHEGISGRCKDFNNIR